MQEREAGKLGGKGATLKKGLKGYMDNYCRKWGVKHCYMTTFMAILGTVCQTQDISARLIYQYFQFP